MTDRVTRRTIALLNDPDCAEPGELTDLVHCVLFHASEDSQIAAAFTLSATPYRTPLATALREELLGVTLAGPADRSTAMLAALRAIGGEPELRLAERIVTATGVPAETIGVAAFAIAHLGNGTSTTWWKTAIEQRLSIVSGAPHRPADIEILRGLAYSAGITGQRVALEQLRSDPRSPFDSRATAAWWLDLPAHIVTSAHQ